MWFAFIGGFDARMTYHFQSGETRARVQYIILLFTENHFDHARETQYRYNEEEFISKELKTRRPEVRRSAMGCTITRM